MFVWSDVHTHGLSFLQGSFFVPRGCWARAYTWAMDATFQTSSFSSPTMSRRVFQRFLSEDLFLFFGGGQSGGLQPVAARLRGVIFSEVVAGVSGFCLLCACLGGCFCASCCVRCRVAARLLRRGASSSFSALSLLSAAIRLLRYTAAALCFIPDALLALTQVVHRLIESC